jgi:hypothetical protein
VIADFRSDAVYAVMLVEEDNSRDIGAEVLGARKAQTALTWKTTMLAMLGGRPGPATEAQRASAFQGLSSTMEGLASIYMEFPTGNDDLIGAPKRVKIAPGQLVNIDFKGVDGGHYQVRFKVS